MFCGEVSKIVIKSRREEDTCDRKGICVEFKGPIRDLLMRTMSFVIT